MGQCPISVNLNGMGWDFDSAVQFPGGNFRQYLGLVARRQVCPGQEGKRIVVPLLAREGSQAAVASKVDCAKRAVFPRWPMDRLRLERDGNHGDLRFPLPKRQWQMAGVQRGRAGAEMAPGRQGVVLPVGGRKDDGSDVEDWRQLQSRGPGCAVSDPT